MIIELAKHSGFCSGVRNAVNRILDEINNCDEQILIQGPLIHSPQTVKILEKRGLKTIKDNKDIDNQIVAIRTHGITRQEYQEIKKRAKRIINLTCSNVAYVQAIVKKYSSLGYFTIILGDKNHVEVQGISSYASGGFYIISALDEISKIPKADKYILVSQTTLNIEFFNEALSILKNKFKEIEVINTICTATNARQNDLHSAVKSGVDAIIVVGGKNSANTKRLAQIGTQNNIKTFHIETEDELKPDDFTGVKHAVVSAGASTPSWIVNNVLEKLYEINYRNRTRLFFMFKSFFEFIIRTNLFSALISIFMTLAVLPCSVCDCNMTMPFLSSAFIFLVYSINNFFKPYEMRLSKPFKYKLYRKHKYLLVSLTIIALIYYLYFSMQGMQTNYPASLLYLIALVGGSLYALPSVTKLVSNNPVKSLRILFGVKSVVASLGWSFVALIIPFIANPYDYLQFTASFIIIFSIIFVRNVLVDLIDYQGDLLLGIETFTTIFGIKITRIVIISLCIFYIASIIYYIYHINLLAALYLINMGYFYFLYKKIKANYYFYRLKYELYIDFNLLLFVIFSIACNIFNPGNLSALTCQL